MNSLPDYSSKRRSNRRRFPPGRTLSTSSGDRIMDSSYTLEPTRLSRSRSLGDNSLTLSDALLDMSGSDRNSSKGRLGLSSSASSSSNRRRYTEKQLFLAHHSTLPKNNPDWRSGSIPSTILDNNQSSPNRKHASPSFDAKGADADAPTFLVFRRRRPSLPRLHSFD